MISKTIWHLGMFMVGGLLTSCTLTSEPSPEPDPTPIQRAPGIYQETLALDGDLRYTISIPAGYDGKRPVPMVLALHYGGQVTPFYGRGVLEILVEPGLRDLDAIIVAPDSRHGSWTNERSEADIRALWAHVVERYAIDTNRTVVTGYSMGGMGTWYIGARMQDLFRAAIPIAGRPQTDSLSQAWEIPIYVIHSRDDEVVGIGPTEAVVDALTSSGVDVSLVTVEGLTHFETQRFAALLQDAQPWLEDVWARE